MKRVILAGIGALAMFSMMGAANAADLPRRQVMPAKAPVYAPVYNWTGFYLGINGGGAWGRSKWSGPVGDTGGFNVDGGVVGGTIGYNWQMPNNFVFGLEGDLDWASIRGSSNAAVCAGSCETKNEWMGTVRGRIGYAFDRFLPYITGGLAVGDIKSDLVGAGSTTKTNAGWALGGGVEFAIAGPWTAKVEYLYTDLGKGRCDNCLGGADVDFHTSLVRGGINYRF